MIRSPSCSSNPKSDPSLRAHAMQLQSRQQQRQQQYPLPARRLPSLPLPVQQRASPGTLLRIRQHAHLATRHVSNQPPYWTVSTQQHLVHPLPPPHLRAMPSTSSIEVALEEADHGFQDAQLLRRANVSPFFGPSPSSAMNGIMAPLELSPSRQRSSCHNSVELAPLHLDICAPLSRSPSWQDFSLLTEGTSSHTANTSIDPFAPLESVPIRSTSRSSKTWEEFLGEPTDQSNESAIPLDHALKTPTAATMTGFPGFFDQDPSLPTSENPTALSPTSITKKVLVTDSDLKLCPASSSRTGGIMPRSLCVDESGDWSAPLDVVAVKEDRSDARSQRANSEQTTATPRAKVSANRPRRHRYHPFQPAAITYQQPNHTCSPRPTSSTIPNDVRQWHREQSKPMSASDAEYAMAVAAHQRMQQGEAHPVVEVHVQPPIPSSQSRGVTPRRSTKRAVKSEACTRPRDMTTVLGKRKIGIYSPEARRERLRRFHEKRKQRVFYKRVKYDCRKRLANACPRVKGRFVRKDEFSSGASDSSNGSDGAHSTDDDEAHAGDQQQQFVQ